MFTRRELERELKEKGYCRGSADRWGDYWVSPDGRKRLYLDDSGAFFYLKKAGAWQRLWGRCWGNLILHDLMI